jgi:4-hydroxymandelate oxidase
MIMANLVGAPGMPALSGSELARYVASRHDPALTWRDVEWLRSLSPLPVILKGLVRGDDARRAVDAGASAVIVSNHGGRQLDSAPGTLDALPEVVAAVDGHCEVYLDGGVRWGTDILKALALGARAVMLGRPILWGLAVAGEEGVRRVLGVLRDELARSMALAGCPDVTAVDPSLVRLRR